MKFFSAKLALYLSFSAVPLFVACTPLSQGARIQKENTAIDDKIRPLLAQCERDLTHADLDSIRQKVELGKTSLSGPPFSIASNDSFPTAEERVAIGKWASLRDQCLTRLNAVDTMAPSADSHYAMFENQVRANRLEASGHVGELIVLLYQQKLTYAEFATKRHLVDLDAAAARQQLGEARQAADDQRRAQALQFAQQEAQARQAKWATYVQDTNTRAAQMTPAPSLNCTSQQLGPTVHTTCN